MFEHQNSFDFETTASQTCTKEMLEFSNHNQSLFLDGDLIKYTQI